MLIAKWVMSNAHGPFPQKLAFGDFLAINKRKRKGKKEAVNTIISVLLIQSLRLTGYVSI